MKFESKYSINDLVKFQTEDDKKNGSESYGHITAARFYKSDAVNMSVEYWIEKVNLEPIHVGVYEHQIIRAFQ
jgi:hypothetical protein